MHLVAGATISVADVDVSLVAYRDWLGYRCVERGSVSAALAQSWGTPNTAGAPYALMQPASGAACHLRLIQQTPVADYRPLRTFGWAAIELTVQDTDALAARLAESPFTIIGPPRALDGMDTIYPMQVRGPDGEIVYLTQIKQQPDGYRLLQARSLVDQIFILVLACRDHDATARWLERSMELTGSGSFSLVYSMINNSFGLAADTTHSIATLKHGDDVFLEVDTYPDAATDRPQQAGHLPPGVALSSFRHPNFEALDGPWINPPYTHAGTFYDGARSATMRGPDGALFEIIEDLT